MADVERQDGLSFDDSRGRWVVAAAVLGSGIAALDATVVGIALPAIGRSFHSGVGTLQWVVTGYTLTLAAFLLLGGSLGDRLGRRSVFMVGVVWFAAASVLCGLAPDGSVLVAARAVQGLGGALLTPSSLAILQASFRPEDRSRAIGAWSGLGGLATAAGPLIGGYLIAAASWRWVFFINVPVAAVVLIVAVRHVPESRDPTAGGRIDVSGALLAALALAGLTYALIDGPPAGWGSPLVLVSEVAAVVGAALFLVVEGKRADPMLPLDLFRVRQFAAANTVTFVVYAALGGALFLLPVELQVVDGYSPLEAGSSLLPVTALMLLFSARSGQLASRIGPRLQMSVGPAIGGAGLILLGRAGGGGGYVTAVLPAVLILGAGLAVTVAPLTATAMSAASAEHSGTASAVNNVVARSGSLIAVAVLPLIAGLTGKAALHAASFRPGFRVAMLVAGAVAVAGGVLAALCIRNPAPTGPEPPAPEHHPCCPLEATPLSPRTDPAVGAGRA